MARSVVLPSSLRPFIFFLLPIVLRSSFYLSVDRPGNQIYVFTDRADTTLVRSRPTLSVMTTTYSSDLPSIKVENPTNGQTSHVKPEPDSITNSPATHTDDDLYEDAGDLDFAGADQGLFLTRVPKFLWERWSQLDESQEVTIGMVRVQGGLANAKRVRDSLFHLRLL